LNQSLYASAVAHPSNIDAQQIVAKLILIGRTYSASVERRKTKGKRPDKRRGLEVIIQAAVEIAKSGIDAMISEVDLETRLSYETVPEAGSIHTELCAALCKANGRENSSFASKYLHFHRPHFFPIVDSIVREGWSWVIEDVGESSRGWTTFSKVSNYPQWCKKVIRLQETLERDLKVSITLREVDNYLLSVMSSDGRGGWGLPRLLG